MIKRLHIRNYAIIEELDLDFATGLSIITGETGAGKSILLGALNLILGGRADSKTLFNPDQKCIIEARFDVSTYKLSDYFAANDLDYDNELIIRREITPSGKSRAFINDTPANLKILQELGRSLIDLHQQFDTLYVNNASFQLQLLDALAGQNDSVTDYRTHYRKLQETQRRLKEVRELSSQAMREQEFLQFQYDELAEAELELNEQEELEGEQSRLGNADEIKQLSEGIFQLLTENEASVNDQLVMVSQQLAPLARNDKSLGEIRERFISLQLELEALSTDFQAFGESTEHNPERLQEVDQRLDLIYRLQTKHNVQSCEELLDVQEGMNVRLGEFADLSGESDKLTSLVTKLTGQLTKLGKQLRKGRQKVAPGFTKQVEKQLAGLSMENAKLVVDFTELESPGQNGLDEVRFLFSANKGGRLQTIKDAASGGEMSRLALVTKSLVATAMSLPTLIFDEIDSGVSGDVARKMGGILNDLSKHHQVVVITHSPQVASRADRHFHIYKTDKGPEDRTITKLRELNQEERIRAIATMLSQSPPSDSAIKNARELMGVV